jgi:hypothetical protein
MNINLAYSIVDSTQAHTHTLCPTGTNFQIYFPLFASSISIDDAGNLRSDLNFPTNQIN